MWRVLMITVMKRRTILKRAGAVGLATTAIGTAGLAVADDDPCDECEDDEQCCVSSTGDRFCAPLSQGCPQEAQVADDDPCDECEDDEQCCRSATGEWFCHTRDYPCPI